MHALTGKVGSGAAALAVGAGLLLGSAASAAADSTPQVSFSIQGPATLIAHGAAISIPLIINCSPSGGQPYVYVSASEAVGKRIAEGAGGAQVYCTGSPEAVQAVVTVSQFSTGAAFSKGHTALVQGDVQLCVATDCVYAVENAEVEID